MPRQSGPRRKDRYILTEVEAQRLGQEIHEQYPHLRPEAFLEKLPLYRPLTRGQLRSAVRRLLTAELANGPDDQDFKAWMKILLNSKAD